MKPKRLKNDYLYYHDGIMSLWYTTVPTTVPRDATRANAFARTKFAPVKRVSDGNRAFCACGRAGTPPFKFRTSSGRFLYREREEHADPSGAEAGTGRTAEKACPSWSADRRIVTVHPVRPRKLRTAWNGKATAETPHTEKNRWTLKTLRIKTFFFFWFDLPRLRTRRFIVYEIS